MVQDKLGCSLAGFNSFLSSYRFILVVLSTDYSVAFMGLVGLATSLSCGKNGRRKKSERDL